MYLLLKEEQRLPPTSNTRPKYSFLLLSMVAVSTVTAAAAATKIINSAAVTTTADSATASAAAAACASRALYMARIDPIPSILLAMAFPFICVGLTEGLAYLSEPWKKKIRGSGIHTVHSITPGSTVARRRAEADAEEARDDALRFLEGTALLCILAFIFTTWAADLQAWSYCFSPRGLPGWMCAIAWIVFTVVTLWALRALAAWVILARNLGGQPAKDALPFEDARWIHDGLLLLLLMPVKGAVEGIAWCQLHLCGRGKLADEEVEMARTERPGEESDADGASTLCGIDEEAGEHRRLLGDLEKAAA